eukprot:TRINITY_DN493_c0_g5_i1.p2 TRINITY_DN493_c0_g5~~TRINITY_DN493_c0_g5_i1.p2  ORF type:complete len:287 (-),score=57.88 TRINITY_DN493_c0_g5_i1:113-973(-)
MFKGDNITEFYFMSIVGAMTMSSMNNPFIIIITSGLSSYLLLSRSTIMGIFEVMRVERTVGWGMDKDDCVSVVKFRHVVEVFGGVPYSALWYQRRVRDSTKDLNNMSKLHYGNTIILVHTPTNRSLHSHNLKYTHDGTSGQQQVTAQPTRNNDDKWVVHAAHGHSTNNGHEVKFGDVITLKHVSTGQNLHSHSGKPSPVTKQQEVTGFGGGDNNDDWRIEEINGGKQGHAVTNTELIRLVHVHTNHSLHSHDHNFDVQPGNSQGEVTCWPLNKKDNNDQWKIESIS